MTGLLGTPDAMTPLPRVGSEIIDAIERSRLVGRGGAGFPVATKWRAVAQRSHGDAVIVVGFDRRRPHLAVFRRLDGDRVVAFDVYFRAEFRQLGARCVELSLAAVNQDEVGQICSGAL